jgi:CPA2 family monovalent cation:H+ antiporter-2
MAALLLEAGVVFAVLAAGAALASRVGLPVIPAYLLAGVLLGPHAPVEAMSIVESREFVRLLSELGLVLLLFFIGLEFNLDRLLAARDRLFAAGGLDFLINAGLGLALGFAFGFSVLGALILAGVVYISSSAVVTKTLVDLGWVADPETEAVLGVLVFEDVVIAVYLAVVAALVGGGADPVALGVSLAKAGAALGALVLLARHGDPLLERLLATGSDEQFVLRVVAIAVSVGGLALAAGVSEAVAAFFLGAAVGATEHAGRVERLVVSERHLYAAVFFLGVGLETDPRLVGPVLGPLAVLVVLTTASKLVSGYLGGRAYGLSPRRCRRVALALVPRGEFSLVLAALAASAGLPVLPELAVAYVLVMSVLGTLPMLAADRLEATLATVRGRPGGRDDAAEPGPE